MPEYDARDVLEKYIAALNVPCNSVIRDASELPYPKEVIKIVLRGCIEMLKSSDREKESLKIAYQNLTDYQPLTDEEREAVAVMTRLGEADELGSESLKKQAELVASLGRAYQAVLNRSQAEREGLFLDVRTL